MSNEAESGLSALATYRHCIQRVSAAWPYFFAKRSERLRQQERLGEAHEKVAENILEDLFTTVLDWPLGNWNNQVDYADVVLTDCGIKRLIIEVKRPGALAWNRKAVEAALAQACRYASEQRVRVAAVSDAYMLYAADIVDGGLRDRLFVSLAEDEPQGDLWWLSVQGIWRERPADGAASLRLLPEFAASPAPSAGAESEDGALLHPKYGRPARCFAYVEDFSNPRTWKLPYLLPNGAVDPSRLPKAIQAILNNYRGTKVSGIPEQAIPAVLERLAEAARRAGHMPPEVPNPAPVYRQLADALDQIHCQGGVHEGRKDSES